MTSLLILSAVTAGVLLVVYQFMKTQDSLATYHRARCSTRINGASVRLKT